jgi:hypothetical protein
MMNKRINGRIILIILKFSGSIKPKMKIDDIGARSVEVGNENQNELRKLKTNEKESIFKSLFLNKFLQKIEINRDRLKYANQINRII